MFFHGGHPIANRAIHFGSKTLYTCRRRWLCIRDWSFDQRRSVYGRVSIARREFIAIKIELSCFWGFFVIYWFVIFVIRERWRFRAAFGIYCTKNGRPYRNGIAINRSTISKNISVSRSDCTLRGLATTRTCCCWHRLWASRASCIHGSPSTHIFPHKKYAIAIYPSQCARCVTLYATIGNWRKRACMCASHTCLIIRRRCFLPFLCRFGVSDREWGKIWNEF